MLIQLSQLIWGRPLDQYTGSYGLHAARLRETHDLTTRRMADAAVKRICHYDGASEDSLIPIEVSQNVTIGTLEAVLRMSHDPDTYKIYLSPKLAGGCIALMTTIKSGKKASPFSYEYGYLCFRILLLSLSTSLLARSGDPNLERMMEMMEDPRYATCFISDILSAQIAHTLYTLTNEDGRMDNCDWVLGWGGSGSRPYYQPLLSRQQARALVNILWEDRVDFLRVMSSTFTPGLAGLMFLNWRFLYHEHKPTSPNYDLLKRTSEIHWRCMLIAPSNQDMLVVRIADRFMVMARFTPAKGEFMFSKSEGSRDILEAYISRLAPIHTIMYDPVPVMVLPILLEIVVPNLETAFEDLFPSLFGVTISRLWEALRREKFVYNPLLVCIGLTLEHIRMMFKSLRDNNVTRPTVARLLEVLAREDLLDLIASIFLSLDPDAEEDTPEDSQYTIFFS
ncbi:unnamed protein product [Rhizoctonia solani]|uniref:Uncharacterized protein n=1 Tax=Rhizoctonia solani TaxID=456999 RepID=A0A8H3AF12_9AGAM|nr:unnamed protein product [Rhizoctonia solani]